MTRQLLEVGKVLSIGFGLTLLFSIIRYSQDGNTQVLQESVFLFPLIVWLVIANYPLSLIWLLWLAFAHVAAVGRKYSEPQPKGHKKFQRILTNRPLILLTGLSCFLIPGSYQDSYGLTFVIFLELTYFLYIGLTKITSKER